MSCSAVGSGRNGHRHHHQQQQQSRWKKKQHYCCSGHSHSQSLSCEDGSREDGRSNIDCFLECTTASVPCQYLPKTVARDCDFGGWGETERESDCLPYFHLRDVWDAFDEWSVYGAGVPISISDNSVVQYYVPYMSALQIYQPSASKTISSHGRLGDESECSSDTDARECGSSEVSSDNGFLDGSPLRSEGSSSSEAGPTERPHARRRGNAGGNIEFEFFERASPSGRAPLSDKVAELARDYPKLKSLCTFEISPASWFSVAWYPIYRIPTGPTLGELAASFLTFHSLSVPFQGNKSSGGISNGSEENRRIALPAFGLVSYKLRGALWATDGNAERRRVSALASSADDWIKRLDVAHPDFQFFVSRGAFGKY